MSSNWEWEWDRDIGTEKNSCKSSEIQEIMKNYASEITKSGASRDF